MTLPQLESIKMTPLLTRTFAGIAMAMALVLPATAQTVDPSTLAEPYPGLIPRVFSDGLKLVQIRHYTGGGTPTRPLRDIETGKSVALPIRDGHTAMYAHPGESFRANMKVERCPPGQFLKDRELVDKSLEANAAALTRKAGTATTEVATAAKEAGLPIVEHARGTHRGIDYAYTFIHNGQASGQVQVYLPQAEAIMTTYLLRPRPGTKDLLQQREANLGFIHEFIDQVVETSAKR